MSILSVRLLTVIAVAMSLNLLTACTLVKERSTRSDMLADCSITKTLIIKNVDTVTGEFELEGGANIPGSEDPMRLPIRPCQTIEWQWDESVYSAVYVNFMQVDKDENPNGDVTRSSRTPFADHSLQPKFRKGVITDPDSERMQARIKNVVRNNALNGSYQYNVVAVPTRVFSAEEGQVWYLDPEVIIVYEDFD